MTAAGVIRSSSSTASAAKFSSRADSHRPQTVAPPSPSRRPHHRPALAVVRPRHRPPLTSTERVTSLMDCATRRRHQPAADRGRARDVAGLRARRRHQFAADRGRARDVADGLRDPPPRASRRSRTFGRGAGSPNPQLRAVAHAPARETLISSRNPESDRRSRRARKPRCACGARRPGAPTHLAPTDTSRRHLAPTPRADRHLAPTDTSRRPTPAPTPRADRHLRRHLAPTDTSRRHLAPTDTSRRHLAPTDTSRRPTPRADTSRAVATAHVGRRAGVGQANETGQRRSASRRSVSSGASAKPLVRAASRAADAIRRFPAEADKRVVRLRSSRHLPKAIAGCGHAVDRRRVHRRRVHRRRVHRRRVHRRRVHRRRVHRRRVHRRRVHRRRVHRRRVHRRVVSRNDDAIRRSAGNRKHAAMVRGMAGRAQQAEVRRIVGAAVDAANQVMDL